MAIKRRGLITRTIGITRISPGLSSRRTKGVWVHDWVGRKVGIAIRTWAATRSASMIREVMRDATRTRNTVNSGLADVSEAQTFEGSRDSVTGYGTPCDGGPIDPGVDPTTTETVAPGPPEPASPEPEPDPGDNSSPPTSSSNAGSQTEPPRTGTRTGYCFVKGLLNGGVGTAGAAILTVAVATGAAPEVVSAGLLVAGGAGAALLVRDFMHSGIGGRAYDIGLFLGGAAVGGASTFGVRYAITGETNLSTGIVDFLGVNKVLDPRLGNPVGAFKKGPDLLGGAAALLGAGSGASLLGKGYCQ